MAAGETTNPYLAGVQAMDNAAATFRNDRYLRIANNARNWRLGFFGLLLCTSGLAGGLVYVTSKQQVIPYVVEVDAAGSARALQELRAKSVEDPVVVQALLGKWLQDLRTLTSDQECNHRRLQEAYTMALEPAQHVIATYYHDTPPEETLKRGRLFPIKLSIQPLAGRTWRARWQEQVLDEGGHVVEQRDWEALIEIALVLPTTKEERQRSPLGVWIANLQWNQV